MRQSKRYFGVAGAVASALVVLSAPAVGASSLLVVDAPQVAAVAGTDLHVPVSVSSACATDRGARCGPATVAVVYSRPDGSATTVTAKFPDRSVRTAMLVVPGRDVAAPVFHYWVAVRQDECDTGGCRTITARAPIEGVYSTVVVASPIP